MEINAQYYRNMFAEQAASFTETGAGLTLVQLAEVMNVQPHIVVDKLRQMETLPARVDGVGYTFPLEEVPAIAVAGFISPGSGIAEAQDQLDQSFFGHPLGQAVIERLAGLLE